MVTKILGVKRYGTRYVSIVDIANNKGKSTRVMFYRSSGTNAKIINGKEYTAEELYGKWFMVAGIASTGWIAKTDVIVGSFISNIAKELEKITDKQLANLPSVTKDDVSKINSYYKYPVVPREDENASLVTRGNYNAKLAEIYDLRMEEI